MKTYHTSCLKLVALILFVQFNLFAQTNGRIISLQVDTAMSESYTNAFKYTDSVCATSVHLFSAWSDIEPSMGVYNFSSLQKKLNYIQAKGNLSFELNIAPVNMGYKAMPSDLSNMLFDNPIVIQRYKRIIDSVMTRIGTMNMVAFNIGNEYEGWLFDTTNYIARIGQWMTFYKQVKAYAKQKYLVNHSAANLKVGTTFTYDGLTSPFQKIFTKYINDSCYSDIISVNYYAIDTGFMNFKQPIKVIADFDTLVNVYGNQTKQFYFTECGYPSGDSCGSSLAKQAQFISNVFTAWDNHSSRIKYISFFHLTDWSWYTSNYITQLIGPTMTQAQKVKFREYLRTIGLRNFDSSKKLAFKTLQCEAKSRGFCNINCSLPQASVAEYEKDNSFNIWPNPSHDNIFIYSKSNTYYVEIYNSVGSLLIKQDNAKEIDIKNLASGIYFIKLIDKQQAYSSTRKIIVSR